MKEIFIPWCWEIISIDATPCQKYSYKVVDDMTKIYSWFLQENFYHVKNIIYNSFRRDKNSSLLARGKFQCINLHIQDIGIFAKVRNIHSCLLGENFYMNTVILKILLYNTYLCKKYWLLDARREIQYIFSNISIIFLTQ